MKLRALKIFVRAKVIFKSGMIFQVFAAVAEPGQTRRTQDPLPKKNPRGFRMGFAGSKKHESPARRITELGILS
jgi:hypothetical protein